MLTSEHLKGYCNKIGHSIKQLFFPFLFLFGYKPKTENIPHEIVRLEGDLSVSEDIGLFLQIEAALSEMVKLTLMCEQWLGHMYIYIKKKVEII